MCAIVFFCAHTFCARTKRVRTLALTGVPNWMQFSRVRMKSLSLSLMTCRLLGFSMFFTHLFAWPCGSTISGQRRALLQCDRIHAVKLSGEKPDESVASLLCQFDSATKLPLVLCHAPDDDAVVDGEGVGWQPRDVPGADQDLVAENAAEAEIARARNPLLLQSQVSERFMQNLTEPCEQRRPHSTLPPQSVVSLTLMPLIQWRIWS